MCQAQFPQREGSDDREKQAFRYFGKQAGMCEVKTRRRAGPATTAAIPVSTKIPAPIIAPTPIIVMSTSRISRLRRTSIVISLFGSLNQNNSLLGSASRFVPPLRGLFGDDFFKRLFRTR